MTSSARSSVSPGHPKPGKVVAKKVPDGNANANNERLRELVKALGVTQEEALKLFNIDLGTRAGEPIELSLSAWKSYFVADPTSKRHRHFGVALLAHAERRLAKTKGGGSQAP